MTTQTASVTLIGQGASGQDANGESVALTATCTDDGFTEIKDALGTLSLYQAAKGKVFHSFQGRYAAGGGTFRIRNTVTGQVKVLEFLAVKGTKQISFSNGPYKVAENDVAEAFCEAVPT